MIKTFEEITSRQKSQKLATQVYKQFSQIKDYWFKDQIQRCVVSISNNIAEWFERKSNNEFKYFLYIAKWSCWEFRSMLYLAKSLWYMENDLFESLYSESIEISKSIYWLIISLKQK